MHIVCTTNGDAALAEAVAREMAAWVWEHRDEFLLSFLSAEEAVGEALAVPRGEWQGKPVVVHETSDNPGGGATGDATFLLSRRSTISSRKRGLNLD